MTSISKIVYIDKLGDKTKYNKTYHSTIKMNYVNITSDRCILTLMQKVKIKDPIFEAADHVRISKYKSFFAKSFTLHGSESGLNSKQFKNTACTMKFKEKKRIAKEGYRNFFNNWINEKRYHYKK